MTLITLPENLYSKLNLITVILNKRLSLITLWLIFACVCIYNIQNKDWNKPNSLVKDDVQNYYIYSVALVVHHDLKLDRVYPKLPIETKQNFWIKYDKETRRGYSKMSMGLAFLYTPFTIFSHYALVPLMKAEPNGYSPPYKLGLLASALIFFLIGLINLRKLLKEYFDEKTTALTLIIIALGTNITWYASSEAIMSHIYSFALVIYLYRLIQQWVQNPGIGKTILTGLIFGLIVLIRPTNLMFLVLFFATDNIRERLMFLVRNYARIILMILMFLLIWIPQFAFWKYVSGDWFLYTYNKETFFWNNPQIINSLFSFRKGWLVYTPLMILLFVGLPVLWKKYRSLFWHVTSVLLLLTYINSSWWCWWYGGSYGNRAYIDAYGIFALGIGALFQTIFNLKKTLPVFLSLILVITFIALNLFQTWQYRYGLIHYSNETRQTYRMNFLRIKPDKDYFESLIKPDSEMGLIGFYYTKYDISVKEKKDKLLSILRNRNYLLNYFIQKARSDSNIINQIKPEYTQSDINSLYSGWAEQQVIRIEKRYR